MAITTSAFTIVSSKNAGSSVQLVFPTPAINDVLVVFLASDDAAGTYSCADNQSNSYQTDVARVSNAGHVSIIVFSCVSATSFSTTITITHPSLTARAMGGFALTGADTTASRLDTATPVTATGTGNASSGNLTTAQSDSCMIGLAGYESDTSNTYTQDGSFLPASSFKGGTTGGGDASNIVLVQGSQVLSGTGTDAYDTTNSASRSWVSVLLAYKVFTVAAAQVPYYQPMTQLLAQ